MYRKLSIDYKVPCSGEENNCYCTGRRDDNCLHAFITVRGEGEGEESDTCHNETYESIDYVVQVCMNGLGVTCDTDIGPVFDQFESDDPECTASTGYKLITTNISIPNTGCTTITCPTAPTSWGVVGVLIYLLIMLAVLLVSQA